MKPLSIFTFAVFLCLVGLKLFTEQTREFAKVGSAKVEEHQSIFDMEPEKARKLLDDLDVYVKRDKAKKAEAKQKRVVANKPVKKEEATDNKDEALKSQIVDQYQKFDDALQSREDNILEIRFLQDELKRMKLDNELKLTNVEIWSVEFIFLLMIQERLSFEDIQAVESHSDLGYSVEEWITMKARAESDDFKREILEFKGVELAYEEQFIEDPDFAPAANRDEAINDFMKRNELSREGVSQETRTAEEIDFSANEEGIERQPSQYDDSNSEYDYEY